MSRRQAPPAELPPSERVPVVAIANQASRGFWEEYTDNDEQYDTNNNECPENPNMASACVGNSSSNHGSYTSAEVESHADGPEYAASLAGETDIGDYTKAYGIRSTGTKALQGSKCDEGGIAVIVGCETNVSHDVEGQCKQKEGAPSMAVGERAEDYGRNGLENDGDGQRQVDGLGRDSKVFSKNRQKGEVDGRG